MARIHKHIHSCFTVWNWNAICSSPNAALHMLRAFYRRFLCEQQVLVWHAEVCFAPLYAFQVAENENSPDTKKGFCFADVCLCVCVCREFDRAARGREAVRRVAILWDKERKKVRSKEEKAVKAGGGLSQGLKGIEEDLILTVCGEFSTPHADVHNHHPRQSLTVIITALATGKSGGNDWLDDNPLNWPVELLTLELLGEAGAIKKVSN